MRVETMRQANSWLLGCVMVLAGMAQAAALPDFTPLVEQNAKAVVNISASAKAKGARAQAQVPEAFRHFFGEDFGYQQAPQAPQERQSFGSGFIISGDGYVLTNNHVVDGADKVVVKLSDRRELEAEVIGTDPRSDVALLKLKASNLPTVKIGNPEALKVGEWVLAIGSPFGFDYSVTSGIVSAKSRALPNEAYVPFIQTDVAINPGNSGGPLFNLQGEVIGINSQIVSRSGGYMGIAFAIPIDVAMEVVEQLKKSGQVERGYLGVVTQDVTKDLADAYQLPKPAGALVAQILPDSPATKAGLKEGDVIVSFDGRAINLSSDLPPMIGRAHPGSKLPLEIIRDGKAKTVPVELAALPDDDEELASRRPGKPDLNRLGLQLRDLAEAERAQLKIEGGVLVTGVYDGAGADAGLRRGDVILKLNGQPVSNLQGFVAIAKTLSAGQAIPVVINRRGQQGILALRLEPSK